VLLIFIVKAAVVTVKICFRTILPDGPNLKESDTEH